MFKISFHKFFYKLMAIMLVLGFALSTVGAQAAPLAALVWQVQTVDSAGLVGQYTSLALDSSGNPVISYYDSTNSALKLVHCGDATCSSGNTYQIVDSAGLVGQYTSLALDSSGNPVISYYDLTNLDLKLVHCGDATCSSGNTIQTVDSAEAVGTFSSLALDSSGNPVISYHYEYSGDLRLVHCGDATCSSGNTIQTAESSSFGFIGQYTSLVLDSSGNPVISYYDALNADLKLVHCGDATCSIGNTIQTVDSAGDVGWSTSLALDASGNPVISYWDRTNTDLKLVHCGDATCSSSNTLQTVDSAGSVAQYTSLVLDSSGNPIISYHDNTNRDLKLAHCGDATCSSGNTIQTVDSAGDVGTYISLALDGSSNPVISYYDSTNRDLKLARLVADVDSTPPAIIITTPADGAVYTLGQAVNADYACQDEAGGSGLASCAGTVASGSPIDTSSVGAKSFTVNAADNAGNPASVTHNYSVIYNFSGFFQPVDNLPTLNTVKAGQGVPVKFSLGGDQGLNILAAGSPISQPIACDGSLPLDTIEQTVTASNSSLSYDAATNTYSYTWKTDKAWAGTCRQLIIKLSDGTEHKASFKFK